MGSLTPKEDGTSGSAYPEVPFEVLRGDSKWFPPPDHSSVIEHHAQRTKLGDLGQSVLKLGEVAEVRW